MKEQPTDSIEWTIACIVSSQKSLKLSTHVVRVERKNSPLTGRNLLQNQNETQSATTSWRFEKTEQRKRTKTQGFYVKEK